MTESILDPSIVSSLIIIIILIILMIYFASAIRIVPQDKRLHVFRLGRDLGEKGPGLIFLIPIIDKGNLIDPLERIQKIQRIKEMNNTIGETITDVYKDGSVNIYGDTWNAISKAPIRAGAKVRVNNVIFEIEEI